MGNLDNLGASVSRSGPLSSSGDSGKKVGDKSSKSSFEPSVTLSSDPDDNPEFQKLVLPPAPPAPPSPKDIELTTFSDKRASASAPPPRSRSASPAETTSVLDTRQRIEAVTSRARSGSTLASVKTNVIAFGKWLGKGAALLLGGILVGVASIANIPCKLVSAPSYEAGRLWGEKVANEFSADKDVGDPELGATFRNIRTTIKFRRTLVTTGLATLTGLPIAEGICSLVGKAGIALLKLGGVDDKNLVRAEGYFKSSYEKLVEHNAYVNEGRKLIKDAKSYNPYNTKTE